MNVIKELQYAIIEKFSYRWPELEDLRVNLSSQLKVKGDCKIEYLRIHHILMRFELAKDFVNILAKFVYYINDKEGYSYQMRLFIYDDKFKVEEETIQAMASIFFLDLKIVIF